jgi:hypothetical protein
MFDTGGQRPLCRADDIGGGLLVAVDLTGLLIDGRGDLLAGRPPPCGPSVANAAVPLAISSALASASSIRMIADDSLHKSSAVAGSRPGRLNISADACGRDARSVQA